MVQRELRAARRRRACSSAAHWFALGCRENGGLWGELAALIVLLVRATKKVKLTSV